MRIDILTIFPHIFDSYFQESILKRAVAKKILSFHIHDIRRFARDKHRTVDDRPYGGGPGMILKIDPLYRCLQAVPKKKNRRAILLTPGGKILHQGSVKRLTRYDQLILVCGRYEGFDDRIRPYVDEEISIGEYVLTGGELPVMVVVDAVSRHIPGVLGNEASSKDETFSKGNTLAEYPQYTRPEKFLGKRVPPVLLSGDHKKIEAWREQHRRKRPIRRHNP